MVSDDGIQVFCIICNCRPADIPHPYGETDETCWYCRDCFKKHLVVCNLEGHVEA